MLEVDDLSIEMSAYSDTAEKSLNDLIKTLTTLTNRLQGSANQNKSNKKAVIETDRAHKKLNKTLSTTNRHMRSFASIAGSFYANFFPVIRLMKSLGRAIEDTSGYLETFNFFEVSLNKAGADLKKTTGELNKLSGLELKVFEDGTGQIVNTGLKNLGLNVNEVTAYMARLLGVTNSIGLSSKISETAADACSKLAGDISSLYNIDYSSAATNLQSGLIGQSRALYKYGIDITNATLQTYAYEMGLSKAVSEMTQAEKMQLRMIAILKQSKVAWGDLANTINLPANAIRQFKNNISELSIVIGQLFIPLLSKVMPIVNGLTLALKNLMTTIAGFFGVKLDLNASGKGFDDTEEGVLALEEGLEGVGNAAKEAKKQLAGYDELNVISKDSSAGAGVGGAGGIDLTSQIEAATDEYMKAWNDAYAQMENRAQAFAEKIRKILQPIQDMFLHLSLGQFDLAGEDFGGFVKSILSGITKKINDADWTSIGRNIGNFIKGIPWMSLLASVGSLIWAAINAAIDLWKGSFDAAPIETTILTAIGLLGFTPLGGLIAGKLASAIAVSLGTTPIITTVSAAIKALLGSQAAASALTFMFPNIANVVAAATTAIGASLGTILIAITAVAGGVLYLWNTSESFRNNVTAMWQFVSSKFLEAARNIYDNGIKPLIAAIGNLVSTISSFLQDSGLSKIFEFVVTAIGGIVGLLAGTLFKVVGEVATGILQVVTALIDGISKGINSFIGLLDLAKKGFKTFVNFGIGLFEGFINGIIKGVNAIIKALDSIKFDIPDWIPGVGGKTFDLNLRTFPTVSLPRLATGGIVDMPTVAMIGERGAEAVMPLERNTGWIDSLADKIAVKMADAYVGGDTNVVIEGDVAKFFKAVKKENRSYHKQTGKFAY